jgi:hypothetical protein
MLPPAVAAMRYANCTALHKHHRYGVTCSAMAAQKQVNNGHYKPYVSKPVYRTNSGLDADKDGTDCEVSLAARERSEVRILTVLTRGWRAGRVISSRAEQLRQTSSRAWVRISQ